MSIVPAACVEGAKRITFAIGAVFHKPEDNLWSKGIGKYIEHNVNLDTKGTGQLTAAQRGAISQGIIEGLEAITTKIDVADVDTILNGVDPVYRNPDNVGDLAGYTKCMLGSLKKAYFCGKNTKNLKGANKCLASMEAVQDVSLRCTSNC